MEYTIEKFGLFFSIKIMHPYFKNESCPYFSLEQDEHTRHLFKNRHLICKNYPGKITIVAPVNKEGFTDTKHYIFLLKLNDTSFFKIANLDFTGFPKQVFYFSNTAKTTQLSMKKCNTTDRILSIAFDPGKIPSKIKIVSQDNIEIYSGDVNKSDNGFLYDMTPFKAGMYTAISTFAKGTQQKPQSQFFYYSSLIRKEPVLGVIDIDTSAVNNTEDDKNNYVIQFGTVN